MKRFMETCFADKKELKESGRKIAADAVKLTMNSLYGKCTQNQEKFKKSVLFLDPAKFFEAMASRAVDVQLPAFNEPDAFLAIAEFNRHNPSLLKSMPQVAWKILDEAKLQLFLYLLRIRKAFDGGAQRPVGRDFPVGVRRPPS